MNVPSTDGIKFLGQFLPRIEKQLKENKFLAGTEMTLADINLLAVLDPAEFRQWICPFIRVFPIGERILGPNRSIQNVIIAWKRSFRL